MTAFTQAGTMLKLPEAHPLDWTSAMRGRNQRCARGNLPDLEKPVPGREAGSRGER